MAAATLTVTKIRDWAPGNVYQVLGTISWSAAPDTYTAGGNTCSFAIAAIKATRKPLVVYAQGLSGYSYVYQPGTSAADGTLKIFTGAAGQAPFTELAAGAVPAGVSGDTITFEAFFPGEM